MAVRVQRLAVDGDHVPLDVYDDRAVAQERMGLGAMRTAQQRAHSGDHFVRAERLGDVVVGAELEPDDAVGFLGAGGEHDDGKRRGERVAAQ